MRSRTPPAEISAIRQSRGVEAEPNCIFAARLIKRRRDRRRSSGRCAVTGAGELFGADVLAGGGDFLKLSFCLSALSLGNLGVTELFGSGEYIGTRLRVASAPIADMATPLP